MINEALRNARINRMVDFLASVEGILNAQADGKPTRSRINKLKKYDVSIMAAKSDEDIRPMAESCEGILELMTDGKDYTKEKIQKLRDLHAEIERMVG